MSDSKEKSEKIIVRKDTWARIFAQDKRAKSADRECFDIGDYSRLHVVRLWDGIILWANDLHFTRLSYEVREMEDKNCLLLNICHHGRCEVELIQGDYVYMSPGVLNVNAFPPRKDYYYPGSEYCGIEIFFDMDILRHNMPDALEDFGIDYQLLEEYNNRINVIANVTSTVLAEEQKLYNMLCDEKVPVIDIRFAALSLMYHIIHGGANRMENSVIVSKGQRRIVTQAEALLTEDLKKRYTIDNLAGQYGISVSAFKKYFFAVYGKTVSHYMREKRVEKAKELLEHTDMSIGEIALECGYEHQGKFGTVFRETTGEAPFEYRRLHRPIGN